MIAPKGCVEGGVEWMSFLKTGLSERLVIIPHGDGDYHTSFSLGIPGRKENVRGLG